jgi:hypothetical protein
LPAKKRLTQLTAQQNQQNAIFNSNQSVHSSISIIPINQATHSLSTNSVNSNNNNINNNNSRIKDKVEPMDEDEEINVHDDDSPLDMRITKNHDSDSETVRPSVIRRAPSFKETNSNSPISGMHITLYCDL